MFEARALYVREYLALFDRLDAIPRRALIRSEGVADADGRLLLFAAHALDELGDTVRALTGMGDGDLADCAPCELLDYIAATLEVNRLKGADDPKPATDTARPSTDGIDWLASVVAEFTRRGIPKRELMDGYLMCEIQAVVDEMQSADVRDELLRMHADSIRHISDDYERKGAMQDLVDRARGIKRPVKSSEEAAQEGLARLRQYRQHQTRRNPANDNLPNYLPPSTPDVAALRRFASGGSL